MILYSIENTTRLFGVLWKLKDKIDESNKESDLLANDIVLSVNWPYNFQRACYVRSALFMAGGIAGIHFSEVIPDGWREVQQFSGLYYPHLSHRPNKRVIKNIGLLPKVNYMELKKLINYTVPGNVTAAWAEKFILVAVSKKAGYKPHPEMRMIDEREHAKYFIRMGETASRTNWGGYIC